MVKRTSSPSPSLLLPPPFLSSATPEGGPLTTALRADHFRHGNGQDLQPRSPPPTGRDILIVDLLPSPLSPVPYFVIVKRPKYQSRPPPMALFLFSSSFYESSKIGGAFPPLLRPVHCARYYSDRFCRFFPSEEMASLLFFLSSSFNRISLRDQSALFFRIPVMTPLLLKTGSIEGIVPPPLPPFPFPPLDAKFGEIFSLSFFL